MKELDDNNWLRQHDEVSKSIHRIMLTFIGYALFCALTLSSPDAALISNSAKIQVPFSSVAVDYVFFLLIGPVILILLTIYLHVFVEHRLSLKGKNKQTTLPYIFNINGVVANVMSYLIFYWLPPITLLYFYWKSLPKPIVSKIILIILSIIFTAMSYLQIRRYSGKLKKAFIILFYIILLLIVGSVFVVILDEGSLISRELRLFRENLSYQDLRGVNLEKAYLREANLSGSVLYKANLNSAFMHGAEMTGTILINANLNNAIMWDVNLSNAKLAGASLENAKLQGAILRGADLNASDDKISGPTWSIMDSQGESIPTTILKGANLSYSDCSSADFSYVYLVGADLTEATLSGTILKGADLENAIGLTKKQIESAILDEETHLPLYLK